MNYKNKLFWSRKKYLELKKRIMSTAVEQKVALNGPGFDPSRDKYPGWGFFRGFSSPARPMPGNLGPQGPRISFGRHYDPFLFTLYEWMSAWMVSIVFHVRVVSEVAPALSSSLIRGGPPCPCGQKKYYVIHS